MCKIVRLAFLIGRYFALGLTKKYYLRDFWTDQKTSKPGFSSSEPGFSSPKPDFILSKPRQITRTASSSPLVNYVFCKFPCLGFDVSGPALWNPKLPLEVARLPYGTFRPRQTPPRPEPRSLVLRPRGLAPQLREAAPQLRKVRYF